MYKTKQETTYLWFDCRRMEVPGNHHQFLVQQDMKHRELLRAWNLDLPRNLEQMLHLCLGGIVEMQTRHIQPIKQYTPQSLTISSNFFVKAINKIMRIKMEGLFKGGQWVKFWSFWSKITFSCYCTNLIYII